MMSLGNDPQSADQIVHPIIGQAITDQVSDIRFDPDVQEVKVNYDVGGVLKEVRTLPKQRHPEIVEHIKRLAEMDASQNTISQVGRIRIRYEGRGYQIDVNCQPTQNGERISMHIAPES